MEYSTVEFVKYSILYFTENAIKTLTVKYTGRKIDTILFKIVRIFNSRFYNRNIKNVINNQKKFTKHI